MAAGAFWVVLLCRSARSPPFSLTSPSTLFSPFLSATAAQYHVRCLNRVSARHRCFSPVLCSLWRCCGLLVDLPARLWEGCRGQGGSSLRGFHLHQGASFRGLNSIPARGSSCREAVRCSSSPDPSFYLAAPASSSKQCQVSEHFCLGLGLKILPLLPAVVQQPTNLWNNLTWLGSSWKALAPSAPLPPSPAIYSFS